MAGIDAANIARVSYLVGIDIGGTFTDCAIVDEPLLVDAKLSDLRPRPAEKT